MAKLFLRFKIWIQSFYFSSQIFFVNFYIGERTIQEKDWKRVE